MFFITIVDKRNNRRVQYNSKNQLQHAGLRITKHKGATQHTVNIYKFHH